MKLTKLLGFVSIVIVSISMVAMSGLLIPSAIAATECDATITSTPSGADIYIDDVFIARTPYLYVVGNPFTIDVTISMDGYETWTKNVVVGEREHAQVNAVLVPLQAGVVTVTTTVSTTITSTSSTTITSTTTATTTSTATSITTTTATTTLPANTITITSAVTTTTLTVTSTTKEPGTTVTSEVTEQTGLPAELTYGAIGVAVIAIIAAAILATRKRN